MLRYFMILRIFEKFFRKAAVFSRKMLNFPQEKTSHVTSDTTRCVGCFENCPSIRTNTCTLVGDSTFLGEGWRTYEFNTKLYKTLLENLRYHYLGATWAYTSNNATSAVCTESDPTEGRNHLSLTRGFLPVSCWRHPRTLCPSFRSTF